MGATCGASPVAVVADTGAATPTDESERLLARRFAAGDREALREVYARYAGPVHTVAIARLRDPQLAEEAVQDAFVKAWRAAASFDPARQLSPWLYQIARRAAEDIARRESRRPSTIRLGSGPGDGEPATLAEPWDAWEAWQVRRALNSLPGDERELVRLTHYVGLSQSQIAQRLDIPLGTVKSRVHRAHRRLATQLAHLRGNGG